MAMFELANKRHLRPFGDHAIGKAMKHDLCDSFRVVLVRPEDSLNIGAVARAMMNLGFHDLSLVCPQQYDPERAKITARWAADTVLADAKIDSSLPQALSDVTAVVGLSSHRYAERPCHLLLPEWLERIRGEPLGKTAILFGAEASGLESHELDQCQWIIQIPCNQEFPSFNLAQAVLVVLYEISKLALPQGVERATDNLPTFNHYYQLDRILDEIMEQSGFSRQGTPEQNPGLIKGMFRRMGMNEHEMGLMLALMGRINRTLALWAPSAGSAEARPHGPSGLD